MGAADSGNESGEGVQVRKSGWADLFLQEDWWAIWLGVGIMVIAIVLFSNGSTALKSLAINPGGLKWTSFGQLADHFAQNAHLYFYQFIAWLVIFGLSCRVMGIKLSEFIPAFVFLYILSVIMFAIAGKCRKIQPGSTSGRLGRRPDPCQPDQAAEVDGRGFQGGIFCQARRHTFGGNFPNHAGLDCRSGGHWAGHDYLFGNLSGDLFHRDQGVQPGPQAGRRNGGGRVRLRGVGLDGR